MYLASVAVFWLLLCITRDNRIAAAGTIFVFCLGGVAAGEGLLGIFLNADVTSLGLIFLRIYQPAASFFCSSVFCTLVWLSLNQQNKRRVYAAFAGAILAILVFSYLYLWTAAAAWLVCTALLSFRPQDRRKLFEVFTIVGGIALLALPAYLYLLSNRADTLDETQTMISTHRPDLFRLPELIGLVVVAILVIGVETQETRGAKRSRYFRDRIRTVAISTL